MSDDRLLLIDYNNLSSRRFHWKEQISLVMQHGLQSWNIQLIGY